MISLLGFKKASHWNQRLGRHFPICLWQFQLRWRRYSLCPSPLLPMLLVCVVGRPTRGLGGMSFTIFGASIAYISIRMLPRLCALKSTRWRGLNDVRGRECCRLLREKCLNLTSAEGRVCAGRGWFCSSESSQWRRIPRVIAIKSEFLFL